MSRLGQFIKEVRLKKKIKQTDIAKAMGYTSQFVCNWERGVSAPPMEKLRELCKVLRVDPKFVKRHLIKDYKDRVNEVLK